MKKLTKKEKIKLTKKGICWKCLTANIKETKHVIKCTKCGLEIIKF